MVRVTPRARMNVKLRSLRAFFIAILLSRIERTKGGEYGSFVYLLCLLAVCGARFPHLDLAHEQELCSQDGRHDDQEPGDLRRRGAQIGRGGGKTGRVAREGAPCLTLAHSCL